MSLEKQLSSSFSAYLRQLFRLDEDFDPTGTDEMIRNGIFFKGANLWILIFAVIICSVGLNMNSTAVVIGAMLISPLMGPIMGAGLSLGINDLSLFRASTKNLAVALVISILTSALYFLLTPLQEAQSELLARTQPTIYDVIIAMFGGATGIVASSRKERGNAVPGVAIATALMPPLCTAGYGLATGQFNFFLGALYLFFINSVFIALTTMLFVRSLRFPFKQYIDKAVEQRTSYLIWGIVIATVIPSIITGWNVVQNELFNQKAKKFVNEECVFPYTTVIKDKETFHIDTSVIEITLVGEELSEEQIKDLRTKMIDYDLRNTVLKVNQNNDNLQSELTTMRGQLKSDVLEELVHRNDAELREKGLLVDSLQTKLDFYESQTTQISKVLEEMEVFNPKIKQLSYSNLPTVHLLKSGEVKIDTVPTAIVEVNRNLTKSEKTKLTKWLKVRMDIDTLALYIK